VRRQEGKQGLKFTARYSRGLARLSLWRCLLYRGLPATSFPCYLPPVRLPLTSYHPLGIFPFIAGGGREHCAAFAFRTLIAHRPHLFQLPSFATTAAGIENLVIHSTLPLMLARPTPRIPPSGSFVKSKTPFLNDIRLPRGKVMKVETTWRPLALVTGSWGGSGILNCWVLWRLLYVRVSSGCEGCACRAVELVHASRSLDFPSAHCLRRWWKHLHTHTHSDANTNTQHSQRMDMDGWERYFNS